MGLGDMLKSAKKFVIETTMGMVDSQWKANDCSESLKVGALIKDNHAMWVECYEKDPRFKQIFIDAKVMFPEHEEDMQEFIEDNLTDEKAIKIFEGIAAIYNMKEV